MRCRFVRSTFSQYKVLCCLSASCFQCTCFLSMIGVCKLKYVLVYFLAFIVRNVHLEEHFYLHRQHNLLYSNFICKQSIKYTYCKDLEILSARGIYQVYIHDVFIMTIFIVCAKKSLELN